MGLSVESGNKPPPRPRPHHIKVIQSKAKRPALQEAVTHPIQILREHGVALEAALSVCLADPSPKPVHRLRTETRRLEAQLFLFAALPDSSGLPKHGTAATRLRKELQRLRRAAGTVRDLDVHRKMLEPSTAPEPTLPAPEIETLHQPTGISMAPEPPQAIANTADDQIADGADTLRRHLGKKRDAAAEDLQRLLGKRQSKAVRALERLLKQLESAENLALPASTLLAQVESLLQQTPLIQPGFPAEAGEDDLHNIRKAAKSARYLAETLPGHPAAETAARRFEALQEAGGHWHDALEIAHAARRTLGRSHELYRFFRAERERGLEAYLHALEAEAPSRPKARRHPGPKAKSKAPARAARAVS